MFKIWRVFSSIFAEEVFMRRKNKTIAQRVVVDFRIAKVHKPERATVSKTTHKNEEV